MNKNKEKLFNKWQGIFEIFRVYIGKYIFGLIIIICATLLGFFQTYLMKNIVDKCIMKGNVNLLIKTIIIVIGIFVAVQALYIIKTSLFTKMNEKILYDFRVKLYKKISHKELSFHGYKNPGELMTRIMEEVPIIVGFLMNTTIDIFIMVFTTIALFVLMMKLNYILTIVSIISLVITIIIMKVFGKKIKIVQNSSLSKYAEVGNILNENLINIKTIKYFRKYSYTENKLKQKLEEHIDIKLKMMRISIVLSIILSVLNFLPNITLLGLGGYMVIKGIMSIGTIIVLLNYMQQFIQSVQGLSNIQIDYQKFLVAINRFNEIVNDSEIIYEGETYVELKEELVMKNINFSYYDEIISNVSENFKIGSVIKINGLNGKGKTTLVNLLCRLIKPTNGDIYIDGINLLQIKEESLEKIIGVIPQEIELFSDTVLENIKLGEDIEKKEILDLVENIGFSKFDEKFLCKKIVSRGINVSGGEKQKVGIIRTLIRRPSILILDEADISLDHDSTNKLYTHIINNKENRITFIITHNNNSKIENDYEINF
ncbi:ABC transporter ATP-binding protein [Clostridium sardiniense]|uniref:ABC transporter ATP-binding protein n=1 Tax=Clostridium sardiniense TaxID=29369 RepID=UPI0019590F16|nr:ABC transporter ATP-binding protein [Clostridium sardiniense]MBM7836240.1 ATP-binding cassette subfamily B protein/subfamily B ATP-binding cassette protein MsbA [Clostridium sardiniense]